MCSNIIKVLAYELYCIWNANLHSSVPVVHHEEKPLLPPICPNLTVGPHCFCLNADIHSDDEDADEDADEHAEKPPDIQ